MKELQGQMKEVLAAMNALSLSMQEQKSELEKTKLEVRNLAGEREQRSDDLHKTMSGTAFVELVERMTETSTPTEISPPTGAECSTVTAGNTQTLPQKDAPMAKPMKIKPHPFDGSTSFDDYLIQFEVISQACGWDATQKALQLAGMLRGPALVILSNLLPKDRCSYPKLVEALKLRFLGQIKQINHAQLRSRLQKPREDLAEFAADVERLTRVVFKDCPKDAQDRIAIIQFIDGISNLDIHDLVRMANPKSFYEAVSKAVELEASRNATRASRQNVRSVEAENVSPPRRWYRNNRRRFPNSNHSEPNNYASTSNHHLNEQMPDTGNGQQSI